MGGEGEVTSDLLSRESKQQVTWNFSPFVLSIPEKIGGNLNCGPPSNGQHDDVKGQNGGGRHANGDGRHNKGKGQQGDGQHNDSDGRYDNGNVPHDDSNWQQDDGRHNNGTGRHGDRRQMTARAAGQQGSRAIQR